MSKPGPAAKPRITVTCSACGKPTEKTEKEVRASTTGRFFCNVECRRAGSTRLPNQPKKPCLRCGTLFQSKPSSNRKYCGGICSRAAAAAEMKRGICQVCGTEFEYNAKRPKQSCSKACSSKRVGRTRKDAGTRRSVWLTKPCVVCGDPVTRRASEMRGSVYCSRDHYMTKPFVGGAGRPRSVEIGTKKIDSHGYVQVYLGRGAPGAYGSGYALEHRVVMARTLDRALLRHETPHHKNGQKADNRPGNLQLWSSSQPPGQRVVDKLAWIEEMVDLYLVDLPAEHRAAFGQAVQRATERLG